MLLTGLGDCGFGYMIRGTSRLVSCFISTGCLGAGHVVVAIVMATRDKATGAN